MVLGDGWGVAVARSAAEGCGRAYELLSLRWLERRRMGKVTA